MFNYQQQVDKITYLVSLVSDKKAIDPLLDTLRYVTSQIGVGGEKQPTTQDQKSLAELETALTDFLVNKDPVRAFTKESLQAQVEQHFGQANPRRHARLVTLGQIGVIFVLAFLGYGAAYALIPGEPQIRSALAVPVMLSVTGIGLAWMFGSVLKALAPSVKRAYGLLTVGLVISAVISTQYPLLAAFPALAESPWFAYAGFLPPSTLQYLFFLLGLAVYAKQFPAIKSWLLNWKIVAAVSAVIVAATVLVPHPPAAHELFFDISLASFGLDIFFSLSGAYLGFKVVSQITPQYAKAIGAFAWSLVAYAIPSVILGAFLATSGELSPVDPLSNSVAILFIAAMILQFVSAYRFKRAIQE